MTSGMTPDKWLSGERIEAHSNPLIDSMAQTFQRCLETAQKKNVDYASGSDPFKNFRASDLVGVDPRRAILVRLTDKLSRLGNLLDAEPKVQNESVRDTLDDMVNYAAILIALLEE